MWKVFVDFAKIVEVEPNPKAVVRYEKVFYSAERDNDCEKGPDSATLKTILKCVLTHVTYKGKCWQSHNLSGSRKTSTTTQRNGVLVAALCVFVCERIKETNGMFRDFITLYLLVLCVCACAVSMLLLSVAYSMRN